jgi:hypothetical protein
MRRLIISIVVLLLIQGTAHGWGDTGHRIICEIAFRLVQDDTRAAIKGLIESDTDFATFSDSCVFPDHPRHRAAEHFVNLPRDAKGLISDECPTADKCVLSAILEDLKLLASQSASQGDRLIALRFLGHWVGDIHQPLHVSFEDDRGGNDILVIGECFGNLRATWDTCLVERALGKDIASAASRLLEEVTPDMITIWSASDPRDWANESFAIARSAQTGYCVI